MQQFIANLLIVPMVGLGGIGLSTMGIAQDVEYRIDFDGRWATTPLPPGAHFTPLIGATHQNAGEIFSVGGFATPGVEDVAETGSRAALIGEINDGIAAGTIGTLVTRDGDLGPMQDVNFHFNTTTDHSLFSFLSMIAPSPDWIVAVHDVDLQDASGEWISQIVIDMNSYDAGTENGNGYSLNNGATVPQQPILALDQAVPDSPLFGVGSIARITLTRTSFATDDFRLLRGIHIGGDLDGATASDDEYLQVLPGQKRFPQDPPVWIEFESQLPPGAVNDLSFQIESASNTIGLTQTIEMFNFQTNLFELIRSDTASLSDTIFIAETGGDPSRFVDAKTGNTLVRVGWEATGLTLFYPWRIDIDNVFWNLNR